MRVSEQITAASELEKLWGLLMPTVDAPKMDQFFLWLAYHPEERVAFGINRTARKVRTMNAAKDPMDAEAAARYASSVMSHEARGRRKFTSKPVTATTSIDDNIGNRA